MAVSNYSSFLVISGTLLYIFIEYPTLVGGDKKLMFSLV